MNGRARRIALALAMITAAIIAVAPARGGEMAPAPIAEPAPIRRTLVDWDGPYGGVVFAGEEVHARFRGLNLDPQTFEDNGELAGLVIGYLLRRGDVVLAGEVDMVIGEIARRWRGPVSIKADFIASARARLGLVAGRALPFLTAGIGVAGIDTRSSVFINGERSADVAAMVGGGVEYAVSRRLSGRLEYIYARFLGDNRTGLEDMHIIRAGIIVHPDFR